MAPFPVTFSDLEGHLCRLKPFFETFLSHIHREIERDLFTTCLDMNRKAQCS